MRSVRLNDELEHRVEQAAGVSGIPVSELIRQAVRQRCREVLSDTLQARLSDVVGSVAGKGRRGRSRGTGRQFTRLLKRRRKAGR